ncbi:MAG: tRNA uridine-5-carboxymethylaminomethyl(34) synthesis GTPase MnmE [Bacteroidetes bacterium]|nr:tRNA uridine-5-carboxymethylaminomethyl(34) synthesis GTPase MnmE [Bacteroidota bacterium]
MFYPDTSSIAAIATPAGSGAIAVIRLSGADAFEIASRVFQPAGLEKNVCDYHTHTIHFGSIIDGKKHLDDVLLHIFRAPHSYTGENVAEISCHGSVYIQQQILQLLVKQGARLAQPGEFTLRAFLNRKMDLSRAEAVADLIASRSEAQHRIALQQMRGGVSGEIRFLREELIRFASLIELELDFSEEDVEFAGRKELLTLIETIREKISRLTESFETGNAIKNGIPVVIAGRTNVGKSTLLNVLLNEDRAIVSEIPGTTRDIIEDEIIMGGMVFRFIDTAGIRSATDAIEAEGVRRTLEKIKTSSVILYVFDVTEMKAEYLKTTIEDFRKLTSGNKSHLIPVGNKMDKSNLAETKKEFSSLGNILFISALKKLNIDLLRNKILEVSSAEAGFSGDIIISNARHWDAIVKADEALKRVEEGLTKNLTGELIAADLRMALNHLAAVTGEVSPEDLLENIFSRFCIGK